MIDNQDTLIFTDKQVVYSNFWRRVGAFFIDAIICSAANRLINMPVGTGNAFDDFLVTHTFSYVVVAGIVVNAVVMWLYYAFMESSQLQATVGKLAAGIKVTDTSGYRISFLRATGRHFAKYISSLILCIGYLMMLWDDRKQTLHDKMAGTLVVRK